MSTAAEYGVLGIGNAIVDVLARCDDAFLATNGVTKGAMTLIDEARAEELYAAMGPAVEVSGGSAGNTMAAYASLVGSKGPKGAFIGKVRNDQLGAVFAHDIRAAGVAFTTPAAAEGPPTARCLILVTPDAQRTMNTYLGASASIGPSDVDDALVAQAAVVYCEGYLWDQPDAKAAIVKAMDAARASGALVAFTLSDSFCVDRHRAEFLELAEGKVDILFANEAEILSLYEVDDFEAAAERVAGHVSLACLTRSEKGSVVLRGNEVHVIDAQKVKVVDTTGAGDAYAAGFLYAYTQGRDLHTAGRLGGVLASEVISHYGARPEGDVKQLAAKVL